MTWPTHFDRTLSDEENRLLTSIGIANRRIFETSQSTRSLAGMGTTVVGAHFSIKKKRMFVGHVGDSRAYRIREGEIQQLTRDHSLVNEPFPELSEAERAELPKNVITRALGMRDTVQVDIKPHQIFDGDIYLMCSDGLSDMLDDQSISQVLQMYDSLSAAGQALIDAANDAGGKDNIAVVLARVPGPAAPAARSWWPFRR